MNSVQVGLMIFISLLEQTLKAISGSSWDYLQIKTPFKLHIQIYPGTASTAIAEIVRARTQEAQSPPKRMGPLPDSHFEGIISLITHDAKGYINVQKSSQSVNHQTGTETLITTTHPAPRIGREHRIPHLLRPQ